MKRSLEAAGHCLVPLFVCFAVQLAFSAAVLVLFPAIGGEGAAAVRLTGAQDLILVFLLFRMFRRDAATGERAADRSRCVGLTVYAVSIIGFLAVYLLLNFGVSVSGVAEGDARFQAVAAEMSAAALAEQLMVSAVAAPVAEELLFRGLLLRRLQKVVGIPGAVFLSSLAFGIFHGNLTQGLVAACLGLLLAFSYVKTEAFLLPVLMHACTNAAVILLMYSAGGSLQDCTGCISVFQ
ncbi:MAG: lysostaphin resistance A-like protein [Stomatobaculum sp.]